MIVLFTRSWKEFQRIQFAVTFISLLEYEGFNYVEQTIKWSDFQKELHKLLNIK